MPIHKMHWDTDNEQSLDLRGWTLRGDNGDELGRIEDLLIDSEAGKIRYAVASVPRRVLLPVGLLDLDERARAITARGYTRDLLVTLSEYEEGELSGLKERRHFAESLREGLEERRDERRTEAPVNYDRDIYAHRNEVMERLEERFRAIDARHKARTSDRELAFSGTEPSEADLREKRRLEGLHTISDTPSTPPKTKIDIVPIDDRPL